MGPYGEAGKSYVQWCAQMAVAQNIGVPWIMCQQSDAPSSVVFIAFSSSLLSFLNRAIDHLYFSLIYPVDIFDHSFFFFLLCCPNRLTHAMDSTAIHLHQTIQKVRKCGLKTGLDGKHIFLPYIHPINHTEFESCHTLAL